MALTDERVLSAMLKVPRHLFVGESLRHEAYNDYPIQIGEWSDHLSAIHGRNDDRAYAP